MTDPAPRAASPSALHQEHLREQFIDSAERSIVLPNHTELPAPADHLDRNAPPITRKTAAITISQGGAIIPYGSRTVLLKGRSAA